MKNQHKKAPIIYEFVYNYSDNDLYAKIADEGFAGITLKVTDAFSLAFLKTSAEADTQIVIDNSNIEGDNVSLQALATNTMDNRNILKSRIGRNDLANEIQGGSAVTLGGILNATDISQKSYGTSCSWQG